MEIWWKLSIVTAGVLAASVRQDITPRPTGFTTDNTFYVQLNFIPFGGVGTGDTTE